MDWFWASRWICPDLRLYRMLLGLLRETPDELNVDVPEMCRKKANPFLVPLCLLWRATVAFVSQKCLSVVVLWPFLSSPQSKHALSYWKQIWSWFCSSTVLVLHDTHLHCLCLVLLSTGSTFLYKKKKIGLSLSPCSAAAPSKESQCQRLGSSWCHRAQLEKTQGLTVSCTLDSLSTFARAQCKCQGAQALHSPLLLILNCFNLMSAGALQETLDFEYCQHL